MEGHGAEDMYVEPETAVKVGRRTVQVGKHHLFIEHLLKTWPSAGQLGDASLTTV